MKKRALSWLLALTMLLTLAPQTLPVWASATGEKSSTATQTESKLSANTYSALGLSRNVDTSALPKGQQPYGKAEPGNTVATNVINELYVNFNGSIHYGWSVLDNLTMQYKDGEGINWTSSDNFYGAMGYWRPNQQTVKYSTGSSTKGALFATNKTAGEHDDHLGKSINSANKHLTYQYSKSEAFSPNTGKDNYVAEMTIDSASQVYLYIYQVEGGNKRYVRSKFVCAARPSGGDASDKTNIIYNWEYDAMYDIAAGDMDGDGYDEIAVYAQNCVYVYSFEDGTLSELIKKETVKPEVVNEGGGKYKKLKTAVVTLAFGDLNADDKDELVIAENIGYGANNIADGKVGIYTLKTDESTKKNTLVKAMQDDISLGIPGSSGIFNNAAPMVRYANVATGDIDGDYQDELIIAGYISSKMPNATCNRGDIAYMIVKGGSDNQFTHSDWKAVDKNKNRIDLLDRVVDNKDQLIPPVALTCAATQGVGYAEQVFLGGYLYSVTGANEQKTNVENYSLNALTRISTNREYKKDNGDKANKEEIFVVNVVAGNFNGNRNGQEQIVYAFGMKHDDSDRYWYDIGYLNKKAPGPTDADQSSGYWYGQEQVMNYESSYNRDDNKARASLYLSLAAVDCDNDSTLMRYKGQTVTWTKPEVLTVLQSAPYFQDLQDTRDYINQGQTGYGKGSSSSSSAIAGTSLKVGTYVSFEQDFSVFGVKVASIQAEAQSTHEFEYEFQSTKEKSIEVRYSGSAGDDYAVVYAVPYMEYQYETWVPGYTVTDDNLNTYIAQKLGKEEGAVTPEERAKVKQEFGITVGTKVEGSWQPSSVMVPMKPATVLITVDDYDAIAEQTEGLEPIRGNILNSTPGEPATYDKINSRGNFNKIGDQQRVTTAEGGNVSLEATTADTTAHTFAYNYEFEAKAGAGAGGVTVGVLAGLGTTAGGGISSSQSNSYSATVDNLPKDASKYGFAWQFGYRKAKLNNNDVLVLEYQLDNVAQLPSMPKNLRVDSVTAESVTLKWDKVVGSGAYDIYQVSTTDPETKYFRARVPGTADSYTDTNVNPNNSYTYCVQNISQAGTKSIYSTTVKAITLTDANGSFVIKQQPGDKDNSIQTYVGGTATATIEAEYLKNGEPKSLSYIWQQYDTATKKWVSCSSGYGERLELSNVTEDMDGTKYRCQVLYDANLYIYTDPVTLTIGKANSATTLESNKTNQTVNASYVKTETVTTGKTTGPLKETINDVTYLVYTKGNDITVYMKDGTYYSKNANNTVTELEQTPENVQLTYVVKTTTSATGDQPATETVEEKNILFSKMEKDETFNASEANVTYVYQAEPKNTSGDGEGSTDSESTAETYTATEKYIVTDNNDVVVYHCQKDAEGETPAIDFWFVQSGDNKYAADVQTATKLKIGNDYVDINDLVQATMEVPVVKTEEIYKEGDKVTLTATPSDPSQSGLKLSGKVVFKIVNSIGDGSKTVDATIGDNGTATAEWIPTAAGVYTITAAYEGNEKYMGSVSGQTITINVVVPEQKTLMIDSPNSMTYGDAAIKLKTTLLKGATTDDPTSVATSLSNGVTYSVKNADGTAVPIAGSTFDPTAAGTYTVTATYTIGSETLTATKSIVVNKRTVTIVPKVDKDTKNTSFKPVGIANDTDKALFSLKTKQNQTGNVDISCAGINTTAAGEYRITVTYTATPEIDKNYIVVCDNTQVYEIKDNVVKVTNATNNSNGSVELKYSLKDSNDLVSVYGTSMDIPKNAKLIAVASPKRGYRVEKWTEKVGEAQEDTIFSSGNVYETSNTITIPSGKLQTDKYSIRADFAEVYYNLTIGFQPDKTGSIEAYYLTDDGMKGDTFYSSTSPSLTPTTATKKLSPLKKVRITATPSKDQVISGWKIYSGTDSEGTLVKNDDGTTYTGNTYTVSSINANTKVEVETAKKTEKAIKVTLVGQDGVKLGEQASVSFNGGAATISEDGNYTYSTAQHDNVVINLTVPDSLIVNNWTAGEGQTIPGNLSTDKKTLSISDLQDSLDLTVHCKAPNSYGVTVEQKIGDATVTDALPATITIKKNGTDDTVNWSSSDDNKVPEATILRVIIQEKEGYELQSVSCNGTVQTTQDTEGGKAFTINGVYAGVNIVATFVKLEEYTVTFSVVDTNGDEEGGTNGILTAIAERKGKAYEIGSENTVYKGATVTFTATPAKGYCVKEWQINNQPKQNYLGKTLTLKPEDITENTEVTVQFTPIGDTATFSAGENGRITSVKLGEQEVSNFAGGFTLTPGASIEVTAEPETGYEVEQWLVNGIEQSETGNTFTYTAQATGSVGAAISVSFQQVKYPVTWEGANGRVAATGYDGSSAEIRGGTNVTFTATPENGYKFDHWTVNGVRDTTATTNAFKWKLPNGQAADTPVTAYNIQAVCVPDTQSYTVTYAAEAPENGTVTTPGGDSGSITVASGTNLTFTAHPNQYYHVKTWKLDNIPVDGSANQNTYTLSNVAAAHTVTVVFAKAVKYEVGYAVIDGAGQIIATENGAELNLKANQKQDVDAASKLVFAAKPTTQNMVAEWTVNNTPVTRTNMEELGVTMEHYLSNTLTIDSLDKNVTVKVKFIQYAPISIPTAGTDYTIDATNGRVPAETYAGAPETKIRKNGDLTFTVKPNGDEHYMTIGTLVINGYDCIANKVTNEATYKAKCDSVSAKKNDDGSYTVTITNVKDEVEKTIVAHQVIVGGLTVPMAFAGKEELDSAEKIRTKLKASFTGSKDGMAFYDIALKYYNGTQWVDVDETNFPANGVDVVLPYPTGTDKQDRFQIVHMLTHSGHEGEIERITASNETDGLHFHVNSLSPFGVSWVKYVAPTPGGGGGGGGGVVSTYTLTFDTNGGSAIDKITKDSGTTIDLATYKPTRSGYTFAGWFSDKALTKAVTSVKLTANTTVYAKWTQSGTAQNPFVDVKEGAYYYDAVLWAVEKGVTSGTSATTFSPDATVTRGQTVTFLYRNAGSPEVSGTMPFTDVEADAYYAKAVQWAVQQKITTGTSETTFSPMSDCTRGQIVTFLYRAK